MSHPASLRRTRDQLIEDLEQERHEHNLTCRALGDIRAQIQRATHLVDDAWITAHWTHGGDRHTCLVGICIDLRKVRTAL